VLSGAQLVDQHLQCAPLHFDQIAIGHHVCEQLTRLFEEIEVGSSRQPNSCESGRRAAFDSPREMPPVCPS
jgi:hypothetical protein